MNLIASILYLDRKAISELKLNDMYSLHNAIYSLFEDVRTDEEKSSSQASGFLYAEHGGDRGERRVLMLSDRSPKEMINGRYGVVKSKKVPPEFLDYDTYQFKVIVNPTRRDNKSRQLIPIRSRPDIRAWFSNRAENSWGFHVFHKTLQVDNIDVLRFKGKNQNNITLCQAHVRGVLKVTDRECFHKSFRLGIGRGRAFGCGLLQITPVLAHSFL